MTSFFGVIWLCLWLFDVMDALTVINCSEESSLCQNASTIECPDNDDCHILCNAPNVCRDSIIVCPAGDDQQCNVECTAENACLNTSVDASHSNRGILQMRASHVWSDGTLQCPPNGVCNIVANDNLYHTHVDATQAASLNLTIVLPLTSTPEPNWKQYVLYDAEIYCPLGSNALCTLDIYNALLTAANVYTALPSQLWVFCDGTLSTDCLNRKQPPILHPICTVDENPQLQTSHYDGVHCELVANHAEYTDCECAEPIADASQDTKTSDAPFIAAISISLTVLSIGLILIVIGCVRFWIKSQRQKQEQTIFPANMPSVEVRVTSPTMTTMSSTNTKSTKNTNSNSNLSLTQLHPNALCTIRTPYALSPNSLSSIQFTVNNIYGKDKDVFGIDTYVDGKHGRKHARSPVSPPVPPVTPLTMQVANETYMKSWMPSAPTFAQSSMAMNTMHPLQFSAMNSLPGPRMSACYSSKMLALMAPQQVPVHRPQTSYFSANTCVVHGSVANYDEVGSIEDEEAFEETDEDTQTTCNEFDDLDGVELELVAAAFKSADSAPDIDAQDEPQLRIPLPDTAAPADAEKTMQNEPTEYSISPSNKSDSHTSTQHRHEAANNTTENEHDNHKIMCIIYDIAPQSSFSL